jgi:hypothetical protein
VAEQRQLLNAHLSIAIFCEKVLREADNVLSVIRVIDRFNVFGPTPEMKQPYTLPFTILVSFKSGILRGKQLLEIRPILPDGTEMQSFSFPMLFEGDDERGNAVIAPMSFIAEVEGLYWFDVYLNGELVTRMPLRIAYQQAGFSIPGAQKS